MTTEALARQQAARTRTSPPLFALMLLSDPARVFAANRGQDFWGPATVLVAVVGVVQVRDDDIFFAIALPIITGLGLMLTYPLTAIARAICGGRIALTDGTASQLVMVAGLCSLPSSIALLLGSPLLGLLLQLGALVPVALAALTLWSTVFHCSRLRAFLALLVAAVVATLVFIVPLAHVLHEAAASMTP